MTQLGMSQYKSLAKFVFEAHNGLTCNKGQSVLR